MIRQIKTENNLAGDGNRKRCLIKRRLIPIKLQVSNQGDYLTFREKLPHNIKKVAGIIVTSDTPWQGDEEF